MNVTELFRSLSYGELSNLAMSSDGGGSIASGQQNKIIQHANEGLLRLHSRFTLRENSLMLQCSEHRATYPLLVRHAESTAEEFPDDVKFIIDQYDPFEDDLIKILSVSDLNNYTYPLNDLEDGLSLFTPQPHILQVPYPGEGNILGIVYRAKHPVIGFSDLDALIEIPSILEPALYAFIAHKVYSSMNGQENMVKAQELMQTFEGICAEVAAEDLVSSSTSTTSYKFCQRGFV